MRVAFYAPLKPVDHPVPSGDRLMARSFLGLLHGLGHDVQIASRLRTFDQAGDDRRQRRLQSIGNTAARRLIDTLALRGRPDVWFTYHAYHKAPDWLGPTVSRALGIPYVIAEASIAGKQAAGPWDLGHQATIEAVNAADAVLALTHVDARGLMTFVADPGRLVLFPPFLLAPPSDRREHSGARLQLARELDLPTGTTWLVTVAMMRPDIKRESYRLLAQSLAALTRVDWRLLVIGDGEAGDEIRGLLNAVAADKVRFLGECRPEEIEAVSRASDVFVWPALREAYGMAILEALAAGLPVVACDEGGVADLVEHGANGLLAAQRSADALAGHIDLLIGDRALRQDLGARAAARVSKRHSRAAAERRLAGVLARLGARAERSSCN
jgi:glycosyltransferase involved in cell wall biosynthesis